MWGGNAIVQHNGTQTYVGDNSSSSVLTLTGGNATFAGNIELASSKRIRWGAGDAQIEEGATANYSLDFSTYDGSNMTTALTLLGNNNATFTGNIQHTGLTMTTGTDVDQVKEFSMTFQLAANTWTDTGIDGTDLPTGTYVMQVLVDDYGVAGQHYSEYYSATISWFATATNSTSVDEIPVHRAGHAPNNGDVQFRTLRASGTDTHDLMLQVKHNIAYNAALDGSGSKQMKFKFRRLI